jgi:hypothetical protein
MILKLMKYKKISLNKFKQKNKKLKDYITLLNLKQSLMSKLMKININTILDNKCLIKLYIKRKKNLLKEERNPVLNTQRYQVNYNPFLK